MADPIGNDIGTGLGTVMAAAIDADNKELDQSNPR